MLNSKHPHSSLPMRTDRAYSLLISALCLLAAPYNGQAFSFSSRKSRVEKSDVLLSGSAKTHTLPKPLRFEPEETRENRFFKALAASAIIFCLTDGVQPPPCFATTSVTKVYALSTQADPTNKLLWYTSFMTASDITESDEYINKLGLTPATEARPQIIYNGNSKPSTNSKNQRTPLLQGLVYFPEQQEKRESAQPLDYYNDVLVLTAIPAESKSDNPIILAGAKLPVSSVRFPFIFKMYAENLLLNRLGVKDVWFGTDSKAGQQDVLVEARICPSDAASFPCGKGEAKKYAAGIAKLITNLPGLEEGEVVRASAALPLQR